MQTATTKCYTQCLGSKWHLRIPCSRRYGIQDWHTIISHTSEVVCRHRCSREFSGRDWPPSISNDVLFLESCLHLHDYSSASRIAYCRKMTNGLDRSSKESICCSSTMPIDSVASSLCFDSPALSETSLEGVLPQVWLAPRSQCHQHM